MGTQEIPVAQENKKYKLPQALGAREAVGITGQAGLGAFGGSLEKVGLASGCPILHALCPKRGQAPDQTSIVY